MLFSDYFTYALKDAQCGGGSHCRLCPVPPDGAPRPTENLEHVLTQCEGTADVRQEKLHDLLTISSMAKSGVNCAALKNDNNALTQYIIDCTSLNLENDVRVSINDPMMTEIYVTARHMVNAIHHSRTKQLKTLLKKSI